MHEAGSCNFMFCEVFEFCSYYIFQNIGPGLPGALRPTLNRHMHPALHPLTTPTRVEVKFQVWQWSSDNVCIGGARNLTSKG